MLELFNEIESILDEYYPDELPHSRTREVAFLDETLFVSKLERPEWESEKVTTIHREVSVTQVVA